MTRRPGDWSASVGSASLLGAGRGPASDLATTVPKDAISADGATEPRQRIGFSFVGASLAGMPQPGRYLPLAQDLDFLVEQRIALLVSLTLAPTDPERVEAAGIELLHLPIPDFEPPTLDQQLAFVEAVAARTSGSDRVGVHCTAGLGRTGTMLATWLVAEGRSPEAAIAEIRELRPGSIETAEQEASVYAFAEAWPGATP